MAKLDINLEVILVGPRGEAEMKDLIRFMTEMADANEKKDPQKALDSAGKIIAVAKKLEDLKLTKAEKDRLEAKYKPVIEKLEERMKKAPKQP
jgi:hypothetical protein